MVSDVYFPRINGVSTSIATFRAALRDLNVDVKLLVPRYGAEGDAEGVTRVRSRKVPRDPEDRLANWREMRDAAIREAANCDLIHIQTPFVAHYAGRAAAQAWGLPLTLTYHTLFEEYLHHYAPFVLAAALRAVARGISRAQCNEVDAVVVPSTAMRDRLAGYGVTTPLHIVPTGIPVTDFSAGDGAAFRRVHGISGDASVALFIGRVAHEKNIGFLLEVAREVAARLPGFLLLIAGEGPALPTLRDSVIAQGLQANVRFLGYLDRVAELPACYAAADVFVFASRTETQGLVLLEAMAAGLPVVAVPAMGTIDIVAPQCGAIAAPDDVAAFAETLLNVLRSPDLRRRLAADARAFSTRWTAAEMANRLAALYRNLSHYESAIPRPLAARTTSR